MAGFLLNSRSSNAYFYGYFVIFYLLLLPSYNCCAREGKHVKHASNANSLRNKIKSSLKGQDAKNLENIKATSLLIAKAKTRASASKKAYMDKNGEKRDNFVTIPEPFPVNKFEDQPYLDRRTTYVPQPYPVTHVEYLAKPIAVPVEVPNQLKVQHFHIHRDRK